MTTSETLRDASRDDTMIWKITGRYIIENLRTLIDTCPGRPLLYCNYRDRPKKGWMDLYLMAWTPDGYRTWLAGVYPKLIDDLDGRPVTAEQLMREHLEHAHFTGCRRFRTTPRITGIRGADGRGYHLSGRGKYRLRSMLSRFAPWIWI